MSFFQLTSRLSAWIPVGGRMRGARQTVQIKGLPPGQRKVPAASNSVMASRCAARRGGLLRETFDSAVREQALQLAGKPAAGAGWQ
jgi:trigger factor